MHEKNILTDPDSRHEKKSYLRKKYKESHHFDDQG